MIKSNFLLVTIFILEKAILMKYNVLQIMKVRYVGTLLLEYVPQILSLYTS